MGRNAPLISFPVLLGLIILVVLFVLLTWHPRVRRRIVWAFPEALSAAVLLLMHLLFFWQPYRTPAQVPAGGGDLASFFYPIHAFAARTINDGHFPFWDPTQFSGMPHLANFQTAALYPPNLIAYLLDPGFSYSTLELLVLLHYVVASYGVYWLARALGRSRTASVIAGGIFAYSGFLVAHLGHYSMLSSAAWMPFVFAAVVATIRRESWTLALGGALALALCVLGGHQPILLLTLTGTALLALFELWRSTGYSTQRQSIDRAMGFSALRLGFMAAVAFGLSLPVVGPSLEMTRYTTRAGLSYEQASEFSIQPIALIHLVLPTVFGSNPTDYWGPFSNTEIWGYAGVVSVILAALGIACGRGRTRWFWGVVGVLALLFAVGPFAPVHGWAFGFLPAFDRIRGAGRAMMYFDLAVAMLAAVGLDQLRERRSLWSEDLVRAVRWGLVGIVALIFGLVVIVIPLFAVQVLGVDSPSNRPVIVLDNLNMLLIWLALAAGAGLLAYRGRLQGIALVSVIGLLIFLDLFSVTARFNPTIVPILSGFDHPEVISTLQAETESSEPFRIDARAAAWQPDTARLVGLQDIEGLYDPLALQDYQTYLGSVIDTPGSQEYKRLNVRFIITDPDAAPPAQGSTKVLTTDRVALWEIEDWGSRAWLEGAQSVALKIDQNGPNSLQIQTPEDSPGGELIVSQAWYPGWSASIDGQIVEVERFEGALQRIDVGPGQHEITLTFEPRAWLIWLVGAGLAAVAWLAALVLLVVQTRRKVRIRPEVSRR